MELFQTIDARARVLAFPQRRTVRDDLIRLGVGVPVVFYYSSSTAYKRQNQNVVYICEIFSQHEKKKKITGLIL